MHRFILLCLAATLSFSLTRAAAQEVGAQDAGSHTTAHAP
jgi:hypothetical protein